VVTDICLELTIFSLFQVPTAVSTTHDYAIRVLYIIESLNAWLKTYRGYFTFCVVHFVTIFHKWLLSIFYATFEEHMTSISAKCITTVLKDA
jgi:hypothetical protein